MDDIDDNLPESVDDLRKIQLLGSGSYGIVYLVQDLNTKQYYALKEVPKSRTVSDEVKILTAIKHPLVVCTHKVFEDEAHLYLLMEWVEGGELWHHLHNHPGGHFTQDAAVFYAAEIIIVLEYLQSLNIVYRDLKPENILISKTGHIKLVDFGFAKYIPEGRATSFVGSPEFLAPEVIRGKPYGYAADLWSLGVVIYEMISGIAPFRDDDVMKLYRRIVDAKVGFTDHFDKHGKDLVQQLLVKDPERRIGNRAKGIIELKMHPWFRGCPWDTSVMTPPIIPVLHNASDTSYFAYNQHHGVSSSINYGPIRVTLSKLIEKATKEESIASHPTIIEDLALTCWCYTTPPILLQELVLRYASQPTPTEKKKINYKKQKHFKRERIVTILQTWIPYLLKNEYEETFNVSKKVYTILYTSPTASPTITADSTSDNTLVRTSSKKKSPKITPQNPPTSLQSTHTSSETTTPLSMLITKGNRGKPANSPFAFTKKESDADSLANVADKTVSLKDLLVLFIEYIGKRTPNTGLLELLQTCDAKAVTLPIPRLAQGANMPVGSSVRSMSAESLIVERSQSPTMTRPPSSRGSSSEKFEFLRIPIDEIVSQIMECDINLFSKVGIRELVDGKTHEGSNVSKMISNFNWTSRWIVTQILQQDKPAIRASVISNFITSAITFSENGDFNALMVVVSALNSAAIYRLRTTWSLVPPNLVSELTMLERMMRSTNNYASYREKLALLYFQRKPVVPYFAAYLSDIRYCRATFAATIFEGLMVNMDFVHEMGAKLRELLNFQSTLQTYMSQHHFPFQKERKNASNYVNLYTMRALPDGELYTISELREETTADNTTTTTTNNANVSQKMEMREVTRRLTDLGMSKNQTPPQKMKGRDWQTVFTYATKAKYDANFTILAEGEPVDAFYRVLSGKVILQKVGMDGSVKIIGSVSPGGIFGEVSLLDDKKNHLSWGSAVTAEETEVAVLTDTFILKLLNSEAELAGRFLKFLASGIASRLRTASAVVPLKTEGSGAVATNLAQDSKQNINDKLEDMEEEISMDKLFGLKNELPLKVYATKVGILSGIMVVTKQHICSFTKAFGLKQKMVIPIAEVTDEIRPKGKDTLIITYNKKTRRFSFRENLLPEVVDMLNSIRQASKSGAEVVNRAARRATEDITYGNSELRFNLELVLGKENRVPESVQFDTSEVLTDKDWALLLKGAHVSSFAPGTVLIQEGDTPQQLFQIVKGSVTVEKDIPNSEKRVVIARRTVGEIFGEISFLDDEGQSGGASASVVAETNVELYILSEQFVNVLLSVYTELAPKFYKYLACLMQNRIYELAPIKPALGPITSKNTNTNTP